MPTTLTKGATTLTLPDHLLWPDEFLWSSTQASSRYSAGGALLVDVGTKLAGRRITLQGGVDGNKYYGTASRSQALTLRSWTDDPAAAMTLVYRGVTYAVAFAPVEAPVSFVQIVDYSTPVDADIGYFTLQLITTA